MIDDAWDSIISEGHMNLTHINTNRSAIIDLNTVNSFTEDALQSLYDDTLSDKDVMLAFTIFCNYVRNR